MNTVTYFGGQAYKHSDYTTAAKQKTLPEPVKKIIQGDKYVEPIEPIETNNI
jgi:hypothetical protein